MQYRKGRRKPEVRRQCLVEPDSYRRAPLRSGIWPTLCSRVSRLPPRNRRLAAALRSKSSRDALPTMGGPCALVACERIASARRRLSQCRARPLPAARAAKKDARDEFRSRDTIRENVPDTPAGGAGSFSVWRSLARSSENFSACRRRHAAVAMQSHPSRASGSQCPSCRTAHPWARSRACAHFHSSTPGQ